MGHVHIHRLISTTDKAVAVEKRRIARLRAWLADPQSHGQKLAAEVNRISKIKVENGRITLIKESERIGTWYHDARIEVERWHVAKVYHTSVLSDENADEADKIKAFKDLEYAEQKIAHFRKKTMSCLQEMCTCVRPMLEDHESRLAKARRTRRNLSHLKALGITQLPVGDRGNINDVSLAAFEMVTLGLSDKYNKMTDNYKTLIVRLRGSYDDWQKHQDDGDMCGMILVGELMAQMVEKLEKNKRSRLNKSVNRNAVKIARNYRATDLKP
ncbi:MAG: hypothetical protein U9N14_01215 [Pseudomonadota bacterium]|nr:hypothetical protein [Pseudomonadota bacterium]